MKHLDIQVIDIVADPHHTTDEEEKISSSSARKRLLGTLLRPPVKVCHAAECIRIIYSANLVSSSVYIKCPTKKQRILSSYIEDSVEGFGLQQLHAD